MQNGRYHYTIIKTPSVRALDGLTFSLELPHDQNNINIALVAGKRVYVAGSTTYTTLGNFSQTLHGPTQININRTTTTQTTSTTYTSMSDFTAQMPYIRDLKLISTTMGMFTTPSDHFRYWNAGTSTQFVAPADFTPNFSNIAHVPDPESFTTYSKLPDDLFFAFYTEQRPTNGVTDWEHEFQIRISGGANQNTGIMIKKPSFISLSRGFTFFLIGDPNTYKCICGNWTASSVGGSGGLQYLDSGYGLSPTRRTFSIVPINAYPNRFPTEIHIPDNIWKNKIGSVKIESYLTFGSISDRLEWISPQEQRAVLDELFVNNIVWDRDYKHGIQGIATSIVLNGVITAQHATISHTMPQYFSAPWCENSIYISVQMPATSTSTLTTTYTQSQENVNWITRLLISTYPTILDNYNSGLSSQRATKYTLTADTDFILIYTKYTTSSGYVTMVSQELPIGDRIERKYLNSALVNGITKLTPMALGRGRNTLYAINDTPSDPYLDLTEQTMNLNSIGSIGSTNLRTPITAAGNLYIYKPNLKSLSNWEFTLNLHNHYEKVYIMGGTVEEITTRYITEHSSESTSTPFFSVTLPNHNDEYADFNIVITHGVTSSDIAFMYVRDRNFQYYELYRYVNLQAVDKFSSTNESAVSPRVPLYYIMGLKTTFSLKNVRPSTTIDVFVVSKTITSPRRLCLCLRGETRPIVAYHNELVFYEDGTSKHVTGNLNLHMNGTANFLTIEYANRDNWDNLISLEDAQQHTDTATRTISIVDSATDLANKVYALTHNTVGYTYGTSDTWITTPSLDEQPIRASFTIGGGHKGEDSYIYIRNPYNKSLNDWTFILRTTPVAGKKLLLTAGNDSGFSLCLFGESKPIAGIDGYTLYYMDGTTGTITDPDNIKLTCHGTTNYIAVGYFGSNIRSDSVFYITLEDIANVVRPRHETVYTLFSDHDHRPINGLYSEMGTIRVNHPDGSTSRLGTIPITNPQFTITGDTDWLAFGNIDSTIGNTTSTNTTLSSFTNYIVNPLNISN